MSAGSFSLQPFPAAGAPPAIEITGEISRGGETLVLSYDLRGRLAEVVIPPAAPEPARRHGLWQETCFEFFLGPQAAPQYWEFNLSPAGLWNVYHFAGYRQGRQDEAAFDSLSCSVRRQPEVLQLTLKVDLARIVPAAQAVEVGISAVVKLHQGAVTYWALRHPGPQPDFHRRDGFIITL